jgi:hypothetical protein
MMGSGAQVSKHVQPTEGDAAPQIDRRANFAHWMRVAYVVLLLIDMVWKPGA